MEMSILLLYNLYQTVWLILSYAAQKKHNPYLKVLMVYSCWWSKLSVLKNNYFYGLIKISH